MTGLASNYAPSTVHELTSPRFEFPSATGTPVLEYHVHTDFASGESFFIEMDIGDGAGFVMLPDSLLNMSTGGWFRYRRAIPSVAGQPGVQFRFVMTSDSSGEAEGVAIDDVSIRIEDYPGSESLEGDDLNMDVFLDGQLALGQNSTETIQPGETVTVITSSPNSLLVGGDYYLVSEAFFGTPNFAQAAPDIWFALGTTTFLLDGGAEFPLGIQVLLPSFGALHSYSYPGGAAGLSLMMQAVVVKPGAVQNGFYASSDALLLSFN